MGHAFISYNKEQLSSANRLKDLLNANGIRTWMAPDDIRPGQKYPVAINMAIRNCSCLVLLLTNDSMNSEHVERELDIALSRLSITSA